MPITRERTWELEANRERVERFLGYCFDDDHVLLYRQEGGTVLQEFLSELFDAEGKEPYLFIAVQDVLLTAHGGWDKVADSTRFVTFILKLRNDRTEKNVIDGGKASLHFDDGWEDADLYKDAFWPKPKGDGSAEIVVVGQGHDVRNKAIVIERGVPQIFAATFVFSGGSGDDPWPDFSNRQFELKLTDGFGRSYRRSGITPTSLKENLTFL